MDQSDKATTRGRSRGETNTENCSLFGPQRICREFREKMNADDDDGTVEFARAHTLVKMAKCDFASDCCVLFLFFIPES